MTIRNPVLATDSYKFSQFAQYPSDARIISSSIEARGTVVPGAFETVLFGVQGFIREVLNVRVTKQHVEAAKLFCVKHGTPFNYDGWMIVVNEHGGYAPIEIEAVPEGTPIPLKNTLVQIRNLDERLPWLPSFYETLLLSYVWSGSTVATLSREIKKTIKKYLDLTSDNPDAELPWKLQDFGYRGVSAGAADLLGCAHLLNFNGTDTVAGIEYAMAIYDADVCGFSISASEHSTMTSWGRENEYEAYANMVAQYAKPGATFACVIDSYDTLNAVRMWCASSDEQGNQYRPDGKSLTQLVKEAGATVVLRPDSGDAIQMPIDVIKEVIRWEGQYWNDKGFSVMPDHIRVIQGDGIDHADIGEILQLMYDMGLSASNIVFGMGGGLLQKINRDLFKFAMKANAINRNGVWHDVVKDPVGDKSKKSKAGVQILLRCKETGEYKTLRKDSPEVRTLRAAGWYPVMRTVYSSSFGYTYVDPITFDEARNNAKL